MCASEFLYLIHHLVIEENKQRRLNVYYQIDRYYTNVRIGKLWKSLPAFPLLESSLVDDFILIQYKCRFMARVNSPFICARQHSPPTQTVLVNKYLAIRKLLAFFIDVPTYYIFQQINNVFVTSWRLRHPRHPAPALKIFFFNSLSKIKVVLLL